MQLKGILRLNKFCRFRTKKPAAIAPLLPLTFIVGYQADLAYGTKVNRIRAEAENILQYEHDLTDMPGGLPSLASIDAGRIKVQVREKLRILSFDFTNQHDQFQSKEVD